MKTTKATKVQMIQMDDMSGNVIIYKCSNCKSTVRPLDEVCPKCKVEFKN